MRPVDITEVVTWILDHRSGDAFKDYSPNKIVNEIKEACKSGCFRIELNSKEDIIGVVCGQKFHEAKCILIHDILTTHPDALKLLWKRYLTTFPDWSLVAGHRGKMKTIYRAKQKV
jgi:hypothetical protein